MHSKHITLFVVTPMHFKPARKTITMTLMFIISLYCSQISASGSSCILLGPEPSFIIKFHHPPPLLLAREQLSPGDLRQIAIPGIRLTHAKHMVKGYYVVHFKSEKQDNTLLQASASGSGCYSSKVLSEIVDKIKQSPMIAEVTPNFLSSIMEVSQENVSIQWNLQTPPGGIEAENTWVDFTRGAPHTTIAVLDTGIVNNDALNPNILPGVHFTNAGDVGISAIPSCMNCAGFNHGTMVAGVIASTGELAYGQTLFGVAPHSTILPINVFTQFTDQKICGFPPCLFSYLSDQINALAWLSGNNFANLNSPPSTIVGINMSLGNVTACPDVAQYALNQLQERGISVIVAAGNQNNDAARDYPANCNNVISVAATGFYGERASYSNWGKSVTIAAPGGNKAYSIYSTIDDAYIYKQGTSLAAPHVSGIIALLYAIDPTLNPTKVKEIIASQDSVTTFPASDILPTGAISCIDTQFPEKSCGAGIINAYKAAQKVHALV